MITEAVIMSWGISIILFFIINSNVGEKKSFKRKFYRVLVSIVIASTFEWLGDKLYVENSLIILHYILTIGEFCILPLIIYFISNIFEANYVSRLEIKAKRIMLFLLIIHTSLEIFSIKNGLIFYIDKNNEMQYGPGYFAYRLIIIFSIIYLFVRIYCFSSFYQNKSGFVLCLIFSFMIFGVLIQLICQEIKTLWITLCVSVLFIYIYYNELLMYVDRLTGLLNQNSYNNAKEKIIGQSILIIFDVDDFKNINDKYGHSFGNKILNVIGELIKKCYSPYGYCYRIGGDEFAVIIQNWLDSEELYSINSRFASKLTKLRRTYPEIPYVSYGFSIFNALNQDDIRAAEEEADRNMYKLKSFSKTKREEN